MKYLKKFNETKEATYSIEDIKSFCEDNLSYLLDYSKLDILTYGSRNTIIYHL